MHIYSCQRASKIISSLLSILLTVKITFNMVGGFFLRATALELTQSVMSVVVQYQSVSQNKLPKCNFS